MLLCKLKIERKKYHPKPTTTTIFDETYSVTWNMVISLIQISNMSDTIKLFRLLEEYYHALGIRRSIPNQTEFNWKSFIILLWMINVFMSTAAYFLFETKIDINYAETVKAFYFSSTEFNFLFCLVINTWKAQKIHLGLDCADEIVKKSKLKIANRFFTSFELNNCFLLILFDVPQERVIPFQKQNTTICFPKLNACRDSFTLC